MGEQQSLPVYAAVLTDTGGRGTNEDAVYTSEKVDKAKLEAHGYLYIVADGTGGQEGGQTASSMAAAIIGERYYDDSSEADVTEKLRSAVETAHEALYQLATKVSAWSQMSTTLVAALIKGNQLYVAHVGDSRAYVVHEGQAKLITRDHVWLEDDENYGSLTRWLGGRRPAVEVDVNQFELSEGDKVLLCSDGLTNVVDQGDIRTVLSQSSPTAATQQLVQLANQRGTSDNVSTAVVQYGGPPPKAVRTGKGVPLSAIAIGAPLIIVVLLVGLVVFGGRRGDEDLVVKGEGGGTAAAVEDLPATATLVQKLQIESTATATARPQSTEQQEESVGEREPTSTPQPTPTPTQTPRPRPTRVPATAVPTPPPVEPTTAPTNPPPPPSNNDPQPPPPPDARP